MIRFLIMPLLFLFYSCQESFDSKYEKALKLSEESKYRESNTILYTIINSEKSSDIDKYKSYFLYKYY